MNTESRMTAAVVLAGVAVLAALWLAAIAPKRSDHAQVKENVAAQEARLSAAKTQVAAYGSSRKQFSGLLVELRHLDKAVPARGAIAVLLRQLQRRANVRGSDLRLAALKEPGAASTSTAAPATPGATAGPGGLSALPFTFEYTGKYFDLLDILAAVRRSVSVKSGDLAIDGRLLTIDGLSFNRPAAASPLTKATINATAYIAPRGAATPQVPAGATATANGGS
jgi:hypothetical protein